MSTVVSAHYGKARIPVMKIERSGEQHSVFQAVIAVDTEGERVVDAYTRSDNSAIVATDTMKNFVYACVFREPIRSLEDLARHVGREHLRQFPTMSRVVATVDEVAWERIEHRQDGRVEADRISFLQRGRETDYARADCRRDGVAIEAGFRGLTLLKTTDSAFGDYAVDEYTTLPFTEDRVLATNATVDWKVREGDLDYAAIRGQVKAITIERFARFRSRSVQELSYEIGRTVLERCPDVLEISLNLPNLHCNLLDLSRFGLRNEDTVYVPTDSPHGDLYVTVAR